jgi:hypothetical protein
LMGNINHRIRKLKISEKYSWIFHLFSDHQTTPMMNGEHHSDKSNGHSSPIKVFIKKKNCLILLLKFQ